MTRLQIRPCRAPVISAFVLGIVAALMFASAASVMRACRAQILTGNATAACQMTALVDPWWWRAGLPEFFGD